MKRPLERLKVDQNPSIVRKLGATAAGIMVGGIAALTSIWLLGRLPLPVFAKVAVSSFCFFLGHGIVFARLTGFRRGLWLQALTISIVAAFLIGWIFRDLTT